MNPRQSALLTALLSQPTAPFRETHVIGLVTRTLETAGIPFFEDPVGNLIVGADSRQAYLQRVKQASTEPVRVFIAHMDHPGFHGMRWLAPNRLKIKWHGGSPVKHLSGARLWLATDAGMIAEGRLSRPALNKGKWAIDTAEVVIPVAALPNKRPTARGLYGGFEFRSPVWRGGRRLYTRAADDLAGVFAILNTAMTLFKGKTRAARPPFLGLLTRGEEVGFVGAVGHFELGWLQQHRRPLICVSLEASRTLPGAVIGKGPVVRLGDRRTVFDADGLKVLGDLAGKVLKGKHQRRIMDGGSCEATAATAYGFPSIGMSLPLGNYHNQGFEGGPDCKAPGGPAPEFVSVDDIEGELKLCLALMREGLHWGEAWGDTRERLFRNFKKYKRFVG